MRNIYLMLLICLSVFACSDSGEEVRAGKYGMMGSDTPQYAAVIFMRAVYNDQDLSRAIDLSTDRFARILKGYHTNKNVQRQIFNLRLDEMTAEPVSSGPLLMSDSQKKANIEMKIIGHYNNKKIIELKTISMVKERGDWKVKAVSNTVP